MTESALQRAAAWLMSKRYAEEEATFMAIAARITGGIGGAGGGSDVNVNDNGTGGAGGGTSVAFSIVTDAFTRAMATIDNSTLKLRREQQWHDISTTFLCVTGKRHEFVAATEIAHCVHCGLAVGETSFGDLHVVSTPGVREAMQTDRHESTQPVDRGERAIDLDEGE